MPAILLKEFRQNSLSEASYQNRETGDKGGREKERGRLREGERKRDWRDPLRVKIVYSRRRDCKF